MSETAKSGDLIGSHVELVVREQPCRCVMAGYEPLTETVSGILTGFHMMPFGPIGTLKADDGRRFVFDAGPDLKNGKIEIVVPKDWKPRAEAATCSDKATD